METITLTTAVAAFADPAAAQQAVRELRAAGFGEDQIGVLHREVGEQESARGEGGAHATEGALTGVLAGAGVGGLWAIGIAVGLLPAIGPVVVGGLLASILTSAAGGAAIGGVAGALIGAGLSEEEAHYHAAEFHAGSTIVTVHAAGRYEEVMDILRRHGGYDASSPQEVPPVPPFMQP